MEKKGIDGEKRSDDQKEGTNRVTERKKYEG
jgi:hypothetical protein